MAHRITQLHALGLLRRKAPQQAERQLELLQVGLPGQQRLARHHLHKDAACTGALQLRQYLNPPEIRLIIAMLRSSFMSVSGEDYRNRAEAGKHNARANTYLPASRQVSHRVPRRRQAGRSGHPRAPRGGGTSVSPRRRSSRSSPGGAACAQIQSLRVNKLVFRGECPRLSQKTSPSTPT